MPSNTLPLLFWLFAKAHFGVRKPKIPVLGSEFAGGSFRFDVTVDLVRAVPVERALAVLEPGGSYVSAHAAPSSVMVRPRTERLAGKRVSFGDASRGAHDLEFLTALDEAGELRSIVDRSYRLEHIVEAHRYVETGRKHGIVVVAMRRDRDDYSGHRLEADRNRMNRGTVS